MPDARRPVSGSRASRRVPPPWRGGGFADLEESVRASIRRLRATPELPHRDAIRGAIIDLVAGGVRPVAA